jgi:hypothetical protein
MQTCGCRSNKICFINALEKLRNSFTLRMSGLHWRYNPSQPDSIQCESVGDNNSRSTAGNRDRQYAAFFLHIPMQGVKHLSPHVHWQESKHSLVIHAMVHLPSRVDVLQSLLDDIMRDAVENGVLLHSVHLLIIVVSRQ